MWGSQTRLNEREGEPIKASWDGLRIGKISWVISGNENISCRVVRSETESAGLFVIK